MNKVESISFPRSGHKLTADLLSAYFGPSFRYDAENPDGSIPGEFDFLKRHDFDLKVPILSDRWYLVQVRDPFDAILSWHKMTVPLDHVPDTREVFMQVFERKLDYWTSFVRKWVIPEIPNRLIVKYRDLVELPEETLTRILRIFAVVPDAEQVRRAVASVPRFRRTPRFYL